MKTFPIILAAAMASILVSCNQTPPPPLYDGNGALAPASMGDPLSAPNGGTAAPAPTQESTPKIDYDAKKYPLAVTTPQPNIVISPYKPYNKVQVDPKKFNSGDLAEDPDNRGSFFRVP